MQSLKKQNSKAKIQDADDEDESYGDDFIPMNQSGIEMSKKKNLIAKTVTQID